MCAYVFTSTNICIYREKEREKRERREREERERREKRDRREREEREKRERESVRYVYYIHAQMYVYVSNLYKHIHIYIGVCRYIYI